MAKEIGVLPMKKTMTNAVLLDVNGNDEVVSTDRLSIATQVDERPTTGVDSYQLPVSDFRAYGDKYVVDKILDHDVIYGKTLYGVRRCGYSATDDTAESQSQIPRHFITAYWNRRNRQACQAQHQPGQRLSGKHI